MTNKELATEFVKKFPHMALSLASNDNAEEFWINEIEKLLDEAVNRLLNLNFIKFCNCDSTLEILETIVFKNHYIRKLKCDECGEIYWDKCEISRDEIASATREDQEKFEYEQKSNTFGT